MNNIFLGLTLFFLALLSIGAAAEISPEKQYVLYTSKSMQLTEEQQVLFDKCLQDFMNDIREALYKDYRASGARREAKVKQAITLLWEEWDEPVGEILREDQWIAFQYYKGALSALLLAEGYRL
jgi:hypothetical protein